MLEADAILAEAGRLIEAEPDKDTALRGVVGLLKGSIRKYDWVGIYLLHGNELRVHNYLGRPTPHTVIPTESGICGAAVREQKTVMVADVNADPRYLSCSIETKSEIVVPIMKDGKVYGEIDIDSDSLDAFDSQDQKLLEEIAELLTRYF
jgi:GAF domain-containing protein